MNQESHLTLYDNNHFYKYVGTQSLIGASVGATISGTGTLLGLRFSPIFKRFTTLPIRTFLVFSGAAIGFVISSDKAIIHYNRARLAEKPEEPLQEISTPKSGLEYAHNIITNNRFKVIGGIWFSTISYVLWKDWNNPYLNSAARFGHSR